MSYEKDKAGLGGIKVEEFEKGRPITDIFSKPQIEEQIISGETVTFQPFLTLTDEGPITFQISGFPNQYIDLSKTRLHGQICIEEYVEATETAAAKWQKATSTPIALTASFPHTLFKDISCQFNGVELHDNASSSYFLKAYIEQFLSYTDDEKKTQLELQRYYEDDADEIGVPIAQGQSDNLKQRVKLAKSGDFYFCTPLYLDIMSSLRLILPGTNIKLELTRADDALALLCGDVTYKVRIRIKSLKISLRLLTLAPSVLEMHNAALATKQMRALYPIIQTRIVQNPIPTDTQIFYIPHIASGVLPSLIMTFIVDTKQLTGDMAANPFNFKNRGVTYFAYVINGQECPKHGYTQDFDTGDVLKTYNEVTQALALFGGPSIPSLTLNKYEKMFNFFAYDLVGDSCGLFHKHSNTPTGTIDLSIQFKEATKTSLQAVSYMCYHKEVSCDELRQYAIDF